MVNKSDYRMFDEMLIVVFGLSLKKTKEIKKMRKNLPRNFMQMKIWKVLTEEQFNLLYAVLYNESIDIFIKLAILMNEEWKARNRDKINARKRKQHQEKKNKE